MEYIYYGDTDRFLWQQYQEKHMLADSSEILADLFSLTEHFSRSFKKSTCLSHRDFHSKII